MVKKFKIKIADTEDYIRTFNGIFELSPTEIEILAAFVDIYNSLRKSSVNINPFSTEMKKKVADKLGRDDFNTLNNYIKNLRDKDAISKSVDGYDIHPVLIPMNEEGVLFKLDYQNEQE